MLLEKLTFTLLAACNSINTPYLFSKHLGHNKINYELNRLHGTHSHDLMVALTLTVPHAVRLRACLLITLQAIFEIVLKGHPKVDINLNRCIFGR